MALRLWKLGLSAMLAGVFGTTAQAGLLPLSATVTPDGDNYRYTYGVMLTSNSTLWVGIRSSSMTSPGSSPARTFNRLGSRSRR